MLRTGLTMALFVPAFAFNALAFVGSEETYEQPVAQAEEEPVVIEIEVTLTHAQDTWMRALEWCESRGVPEAVNPMDKDGTASYASWQFKPGTLRSFAEKYGVELEEGPDWVMNRENQRKVLEQMILHRDEVNWYQQFPDCVRRLGVPPVAHSE